MPAKLIGRAVVAVDGTYTWPAAVLAKAQAAAVAVGRPDWVPQNGRISLQPQKSGDRDK